ncbi:MAG: hypothetical protein U9R56_06840, partial [candidate division Zixibacteria bacterium]|nr:hypothetical protein [candidate division Zixibacteria bacterium]
HIPGGPGVRVDRAVYTSYVIPPFYDSMIAKLIVKARTREQALVRMKCALDEFIIDGIPTTLPFLRKIVEHPDFVAGNYDLTFVEKAMDKDHKKADLKGKKVIIVRSEEMTGDGDRVTPVAERSSSDPVEQVAKTGTDES